jgi:ribonuclease BN (tRNA processing enzyme)
LRVVFLGTGDAFFSHGRHQSGYLVQGRDTTILLDCGASTLGAMKRSGITPNDLDTVFISHLHGDHFAGLPFLFLQYTYDTPRHRPLRIVGPPGTEDRVRELFRATYRELAQTPLPFGLDFVEVQPKKPTTVDTVRVEPFRVPHQETEISLGMRITLDDRSILYSGDTGWTTDLIDYSDGTDLFICECCFFETRVPFLLDYPRLHEHHSRFGCKRLVLTHLGTEVLARREETEIELASDGFNIEL